MIHTVAQFTSTEFANIVQALYGSKDKAEWTSSDNDSTFYDVWITTPKEFIICRYVYSTGAYQIIPFEHHELAAMVNFAQEVDFYNRETNKDLKLPSFMAIAYRHQIMTDEDPIFISEHGADFPEFIDQFTSWYLEEGEIHAFVHYSYNKEEAIWEMYTPMQVDDLPF